MHWIVDGVGSNLAVAVSVAIGVSIPTSVATVSLAVGSRLLASAGSLLVVAGAQEPAVVYVGLAAVAVFDDVVDLAALGIHVTGRMGADPVADLHGSPEEPGEEPVFAGHVHRLTSRVEDDAFEVGLGQPLGNIAA